MLSLFAKGCIWRHGPFLDLRLPPFKITQSIIPSLISKARPQRPRPPQTTWLRRTYAQASRKQPPPPSSSSSSPSRTPSKIQPGEYLRPQTSYTRVLSARRSPTLLYQAPTTFTYPLACAVIGGSMLAYGVFNTYDILLIPHQGLVWFVPWMMLAVCCFMLGTGWWFMRGATRLVKSISAIPTRAGPGEPPLVVRVQMRSLTGWGRDYTVPLEDIKLADAVMQTRQESLSGGSAEHVPMTEEARRRAQVMKRKLDREEYLDTHSNPLRHLSMVLGKLWRRFFTGFRRVTAGEGFATVMLRRRPGGRMSPWKIDVRDGWLLEDGLAIERLLGE